jgi:hypothetical protein
VAVSIKWRFWIVVRFSRQKSGYVDYDKAFERRKQGSVEYNKNDRISFLSPYQYYDC